MFFINKNKKGFTLVEMLVAIGIFSIAIIVTSSVFINVNNLQRKTAEFKNLQNEGRYLMEKMIKEIRAREIDLLSSSDSSLIFEIDELGDVYSINFSNPNIVITKNDQISTLNVSNVEVVNLKFNILTGDNIQPRVTILLEIRNLDKSIADDYILTLQTTVSSRLYN